MQYGLSDTARVAVVPLNNGAPMSGATLSLTIYNRATGAVLVNAATMTEIGTNGAYYYDYAGPAAETLCDYMVYMGSQLVVSGELVFTANAVGAYTPGDVIRFVCPIVVDGVPQTGLSPTIDIYNLVTHAKILTAGATTEIAGTGIYYRDYTSIGTPATFLAVFFDGTDAIRRLTVNTLSSSASPDLTGRFTTIDVMDTRLAATLDGLSLSGATQAERVLWINQACEKIARQFRILSDDFYYHVIADGYQYQVDSVNPYPFEITDVYYNSGTAGEVALTYADYRTVRADLAAGNSTIYRYTVNHDGYKYFLILNGLPAGNVPDGLILRGPYFPVYVAVGNTPASLLPYEKRYDRLVEVMAVEQAIFQYAPDETEKNIGKAWVAYETGLAGLENVAD